MTTHEVLVAARNRIAREGWWCTYPGQGDGPSNPDGGMTHCASLAILRATPRLVDVRRDAYRELLLTVGRAPVFGALVNDLAAWNDTPGRTKEEVLAAFDKAIAETAPPPADPFVGRASFREPVKV